jgi:hypothetical protein
MINWTIQEDALLEVVCALRAELASMRQCFEAADRERSGLRDRAERAEAERDALRAALEKDDSVTAPPIWETLAEIGESAPAGTWDALPTEIVERASMTLPYDTARCPGTDHAICQLCRRREPGHHQWQVTIAPPIDRATGECSSFIAPIKGLP